MISVSDINPREQTSKRSICSKSMQKKSELEIVRGIEDDDWPKIAQIVLEIHDPAGETVNFDPEAC